MVQEICIENNCYSWDVPVFGGKLIMHLMNKLRLPNSGMEDYRNVCERLHQYTCLMRTWKYWCHE